MGIDGNGRKYERSNLGKYYQNREGYGHARGVRGDGREEVGEERL